MTIPPTLDKAALVQLHKVLISTSPEEAATWVFAMESELDNEIKYLIMILLDALHNRIEGKHNGWTSIYRYLGLPRGKAFRLLKVASKKLSSRY